MRGVLPFVVAPVAGVALLASAALADSVQKEGGTLRIALPRDMSVDPALPGGPPEWALAFVTCGKLYSHPDKPAPEGTRVIPEVARGFPIVSKDGRTQTIELKRTYRFHTGQPVRAANFVAALNRDANPKLGSGARDYLHEIVGADAVIDGKAQRIAGVRALGPYALQIRTTKPLGDLAARLTMPYFCPIATSTPATEIDDPLGSGPYYVASRVPNRQVVLERNRFFRGSRPANVDRIVWTISAPGACRAAVERDELDLCFVLPPTAFQEIAAEYGVNKERFFFNPRLSTFY
jgi:oligopeptide transport system substrate-binding protein